LPNSIEANLPHLQQNNKINISDYSIFAPDDVRNPCNTTRKASKSGTSQHKETVRVNHRPRNTGDILLEER
jgi:hypothetical protein